MAFGGESEGQGSDGDRIGALDVLILHVCRFLARTGAGVEDDGVVVVVVVV